MSSGADQNRRRYKVEPPKSRIIRKDDIRVLMGHSVPTEVCSRCGNPTISRFDFCNECCQELVIGGYTYDELFELSCDKWWASKGY
jgi:hypothetical protein